MSDTLRGYRDLLGTYLGPYWRHLGLLAALLLSAIGLQVLNPRFLQGFIDGAQEGSATRGLIGLALAYLGVGLTRRAFSLGASFVSSDLGWRATNALRQDLLRHCLYLDMPFHKAHTPGQLIERIDGDVLAMVRFFSQFIVQILGSALLLLGVLVALFLEDWRLGAAMGAYTALALAVLLRMREHAVAEFTQERQASADLYGFIEERLMGLDDIRANGGGAHTMRRLFETMRTFTDVSVRAWFRRMTLWVANMGILDVMQVVAFALGAVLYLRGSLTLGTVYLLTFYVGMLSDPIERLSQELQHLQQASAGAVRVRELLGMARHIQDGRRSDLPAGALPVAFQGVSFIYEDGEQAVLSDLTLTLRPGASVGLLGRTGSGKTTLSRLLFRFHDPTEGAITIGGMDLRDLTLEALRRRVGLVTQDVQLFQATVRDNLTLFDHTHSDEALIAILQDLGLGEWLERLPQGLDTRLGAAGGGLSAGEAQLLALARAFLKDPGLVILDEPSSRLDPATERLIERAMARLIRGRTALIIAHRLGTVQRVDEIMIMEGGRLVECGPRSALETDSESRFAALLRTGMEDVIA